MKFKNKGFVFLLASLMVMLSGCSSLSSTKSADVKMNSKMVVMPPHDVVQSGKPHPVGVGSGEQLQNKLKEDIESILGIDVLVYPAGEKFDHTTDISIAESIAETKKFGADYCLVVRLGEFRNAAPMTFRSDFVTLDQAFVLDVRSGKKIWELSSPYLIEKTNIGNHYSLIDQISKDIALSIKK